MWALLDWDADGWQSFVSDPELPPILEEAGHVGKPQAAEIAEAWALRRLLGTLQAEAPGPGIQSLRA